MKRLIAAGILLIFIAVSCTVGQLTVTACGNTMTEFLDSARSAAENEDFEKARAQTYKAEQEYARQEWMLSFFINHTLVKELGEQLAELPALADSEGAEELLSHIDAAKVKILHRIRDNKLSLRNIF